MKRWSLDNLHQGNLMDVAWERSAMKHIAAAHTPTLIIHGENDNDVPIAEAEQLFVALKDLGVDTVFLRYPREGHGLSEVKHQIDAIDRSLPLPGMNSISRTRAAWRRILGSACMRSCTSSSICDHTWGSHSLCMWLAVNVRANHVVPSHLMGSFL